MQMVDHIQLKHPHPLRNTVMLQYKKDDKRWLGYFQYEYASNFTTIGLMLLGTGIFVGGIYYFLPMVPQYFASLLGYITQNHEGIRQGLILMANGILGVGLSDAFVNWLLESPNPMDTLIAACVLKKLEGIMGHRV